MNRNALHQLWVKRPFTPFRVLTSDGKSYAVGHPEHLWITPVLIGVSNGRDAVFISPIHIVAAEVIKKDSKRNG
jgi:hypothetical protein